jgi:C4-dicarboxylate-specific signal transduction histidine kinase
MQEHISIEGFMKLTREPMALCDENGIIEVWNDAAQHLYGWSAQLAVGRQIDAFLQTCSANLDHHQDLVTRVHRDGRRLMLSRICRQLEHEFGGRQRYIDTAMLVDRSTEDDLYHIIFQTMPIALLRIDNEGSRDLTDTLRSIPDAEREALLVSRPDLVEEIAQCAFIAEANQRAAGLMRVARTDLMIGKSILSAWTRSIDTYRRSVCARLRNCYFEEETQVVATDGTIVDVIFAMAPVQHAGRSITLVGMVDISDRKRAEAELAKLQADFAHAARISSLGELTASLAHEVSQPLSAIRLSQQTALLWLDRSTADLGQARAQVERIGSHAARATDVISRVRQMTLATGSKKQACSFNEVLEDALALVAPQARAAEASLLVTLPSAQISIFADRIEVEQVIVNLIVNALQAMETINPMERSISVAAKVDEDHVVCTFDDTGTGFSDTDTAQLFKRFFTTKAQGMGLGLAICRTIMEAHGGTITAANRSGGPGAQFTLTFPLDLASFEEAARG